MTQTELRLRAGDTEVTFLPDLGMLGISLRHKDDEVLALPGGIDAYRAGSIPTPGAARGAVEIPAGEK